MDEMGRLYCGGEEKAGFVKVRSERQLVLRQGGRVGGELGGRSRGRVMIVGGLRGGK